MKVLEIKLKVYLLKEIPRDAAIESIAGFIDHSMLKNQRLSELHRKNCFKDYVFCSFYPLEQDGIYKRDRNYTVVIRTVDPALAKFLKEVAVNHYNHMMKGLTCEIKEVPKHYIKKVYSLTPLVMKDDRGYWRAHLTFEEFEDRLKINLIKKYNKLTESKIDENFPLYDKIILLNKAPIKIPYKKIHLLADKVELELSDHEMAQKLIYMSLGTGVGESNARGFGFLNYQWG